MKKDELTNILNKLKMCQEITDELNDCLLDLLDQVKSIQPYEELDELVDFCNHLTKWSDFNETKYIIENLAIDREGNYDE